MIAVFGIGFQILSFKARGRKDSIYLLPATCLRRCRLSRDDEKQVNQMSKGET